MVIALGSALVLVHAVRAMIGTSSSLSVRSSPCLDVGCLGANLVVAPVSRVMFSSAAVLASSMDVGLHVDSGRTTVYGANFHDIGSGMMDSLPVRGCVRCGIMLAHFVGTSAVPGRAT